MMCSILCRGKNVNTTRVTRNLKKTQNKSFVNGFLLNIHKKLLEEFYHYSHPPKYKNAEFYHLRSLDFIFKLLCGKELRYFW